jgi:aryl-alcohol dehydrogenase-like predicted oxidoreductase
MSPQLHRIDPQVPLADQVGTFVDLQHEGKVRYIGLSNVSVADILTDRSSEDVLDYCVKEIWALFRGSRSPPVHWLAQVDRWTASLVS